jgi:outer membrane autotransporter protein
VGPYASLFNDRWYLDCALTGGFHDNDIGRAVELNGEGYQAQGLYHANDLSLYLGTGRDYQAGPYTLSPLVSLQYIYYRQNAFTEINADVANLVVDPTDVHSLRSRVGAQLTRVGQWGCVKIVPEAFAGWAHEYLENDPLEAQLIGGVTPFWINRGGIFRDAGYFGAGLTVLPGNHCSLFARYNGEFSNGGHFNAVDLGVIVEY